MKVFSYSAKLKLKKYLLITGAVLAALLIFCIGRIIYLQRFVVYDESGVRLDYTGQVSAKPGNSDATFNGEFILEQEAADGESIERPVQGQLSALSGFYLTTSQLMDEEMLAALPERLEESDALMLDMKTLTGRYLYATGLPGTERTETDLTSLVSELSKRPNLTLIAKIPAFSDSAHALTDFSQSLPIRGGALWMDKNGSYWLDPAGADVPNYLISIARELYAIGFDEIVFDEFTFPQSTYIVYNRDITGEEAAYQAASTIKEQLALYEIPVSFISTDEDIVALSARAFIPAETGELVSQLARQYSAIIAGSDAQLVFLTASRDTRFETYSVLSPFTIEEE